MNGVRVCIIPGRSYICEPPIDLVPLLQECNFATNKGFQVNIIRNGCRIPCGRVEKGDTILVTPHARGSGPMPTWVQQQKRLFGFLRNRFLLWAIEKLTR